jgi:hypothetical protein
VDPMQVSSCACPGVERKGHVDNPYLTPKASSCSRLQIYCLSWHTTNRNFPTSVHADISSRSDTVASSRLTRFFLAAVALFIATSAILASLRLSGRTPSILQYIKPNPLRNPLYTQPYRPLTNSTMAPSQYKTPPQLPPRFTATKQSLVNDAKRLVC